MFVKSWISGPGPAYEKQRAWLLLVYLGPTHVACIIFFSEKTVAMTKFSYKTWHKLQTTHYYYMTSWNQIARGSRILCTSVSSIQNRRNSHGATFVTMAASSLPSNERKRCEWRHVATANATLWPSTTATDEWGGDGGRREGWRKREWCPCKWEGTASRICR